MTLIVSLTNICRCIVARSFILSLFHLALAEEVMDLLVPSRERTYSPAIAAVICKCALKYGKDKALDLLRNVRNGTFNGPNDPARLMHILIKDGKGTPQQLYSKATCGARAFCEGRTLTELRYVKTDICDWTFETIAHQKIAEIEKVIKEPLVVEKPISLNWWEKAKPTYHSGHFKVFCKDNEWIIHRRSEVLRLIDGKVEKITERKIADFVVKPFYGSEEAAEYLGLKGSTLRGVCVLGKVQATKIDGKWQIPYEELVKLNPALTKEKSEV